jgi:5-methylcytosine-specific restriction endonuclease McrA
MTTCPKPQKREKAPRKALKRSGPIHGPKKTARRKGAPTRKRLPSIKRLREKADGLLSDIVRARDGKCIFCGYRQPEGRPLAQQEYLQAAHYYGKKARPATRYTLENVHAACSKCHMRVDRRDPQEYTDWMRAHYPPEALDALEARSRKIEKRDRAYYEAVIADLIQASMRSQEE